MARALKNDAGAALAASYAAEVFGRGNPIEIT